MEYRRLGGSGLKVAPICLGVMQFGWAADEQTSHQILDAYAGAGGNFIDTADGLRSPYMGVTISQDVEGLLIEVIRSSQKY